MNYQEPRLKVGATDIRNTLAARMGQSELKKGRWKLDFANIVTSNVSNYQIIEGLEGEPDPEYTTETLMSDQIKIFWWMNIGLYNSLFECFSHLVHEIKKYEDPVVIINTTNIFSEMDYAYATFILQSLTDIGVKWEIYNHKNIIYVNNFVVINRFCVTPENIQELKDHFAKYIKNKDVKPFRKVYLSRRHLAPRDYKWIKDGLSCKTDHRLFDSEVLEKFLEDNGFEVIIPEEKFTNFVDQINYMYEVDTLVSLSSSGIANALFMQKNTSVIEFITTYPMGLITGNWSEDENSVEGSESVHHLYQTLSYVNHNCYFALPNWSRYSEDLINIIKENTHFRKIIMGE